METKLGHSQRRVCAEVLHRSLYLHRWVNKHKHISAVECLEDLAGRAESIIQGVSADGATMARMGCDAARNNAIMFVQELVSVSHAAKGGRGDDGPPAPAPQASAPSSDAAEVDEGGAEIPVEDDDSSDDIKIGYVEESAEESDAHAGLVEGRVAMEDEEMRG